MNASPPAKPLHMNISTTHIAGNGHLGRYILLPGSDGRAQEMAKKLQNVQVVEHPRRHNFYQGQFESKGRTIDVGIMSSGMGCPSMDIIGTELLQLGAKRIIRVGTAGSLQPKRLRVGHIVIPTASVRDEGTSRHYLNASIPVLSSIEFLDIARRVSVELGLAAKVELGIIHTKDSLYAREFGQGLLQSQHHDYMEHLKKAGVLASEMECAQLFTLLQTWQSDSLMRGRGPGVKGGAILAIVGDDEPFATDPQNVSDTVDSTIDFAFACIAAWAHGEDKEWI
ncbi:MAG: uridine phosphorylase [Chitinophagaceae bacterium]|nr:uridine phosphorylase [Oligoflexus sp.]